MWKFWQEKCRHKNKKNERGGKEFELCWYNKHANLQRKEKGKDRREKSYRTKDEKKWNKWEYDKKDCWRKGIKA